MSWIDAAILSPIIVGVASILESHVLSRRVESSRVFFLAAAPLNLIVWLLLFYLFPVPDSVSVWVWLVAIASGLFRASGVAFMFYAMRKGEVSQIIPVVFTYPVFVAIMAVLLLGETLSYLQWLAIFIVVAGAIMVSFKKSPSGSTAWLGKTLLILLGASIFIAMADVAAKYALAYMSSWSMVAFNRLGFVIVFSAISVRPSVFKELASMKRKHTTIPLIYLSETIAMIGIAFLLWALESGPVSLVSTIAGSRPIFVAMYTLILSRISPQFLIWSGGKWMWALRLVATAMIVVGITIIYLS